MLFACHVAVSVARVKRLSLWLGVRRMLPPSLCDDTVQLIDGAHDSPTRYPGCFLCVFFSGLLRTSSLMPATCLVVSVSQLD